MTNILTCECGASAKDTTKERGRFKRRHPKLCYEKVAREIVAANTAKELSEGVRSVEDTPEGVRREPCKTV